MKPKHLLFLLPFTVMWLNNFVGGYLLPDRWLQPDGIQWWSTPTILTMATLQIGAFVLAISKAVD